MICLAVFAVTMSVAYGEYGHLLKRLALTTEKVHYVRNILKYYIFILTRHVLSSQAYMVRHSSVESCLPPQRNETSSIPSDVIPANIGTYCSTVADCGDAANWDCGPATGCANGTCDCKTGMAGTACGELPTPELCRKLSSSELS